MKVMYPTVNTHTFFLIVISVLLLTSSILASSESKDQADNATNSSQKNGCSGCRTYMTYRKLIVKSPKKILREHKFKEWEKQKKEIIPVIINLNISSDDVGTEIHPNMLLQDRIVTQQSRILEKLLKNKKVNIRYIFQNIPSISCEMPASLLKSLSENPKVDSIEPIEKVELFTAQGIPLIGGDVYRGLYTGQGVSIAIIDSGIDYNNYLVGAGNYGGSDDKVKGGYDFADDDFWPEDFDGHGTSCAGIAAGDYDPTPYTDGEDFIGGVAHNSQLYALKVFGDDGSGGDDDYIKAAIDWCVTKKQEDSSLLVISMSLGKGEYSNSCDSEAISYINSVNVANNANITLVAASGNDGFTDSIAIPSCLSNVISVGAVYDDNIGSYWGASCSDENTSADMVACYSNSSSILDVLAPSSYANTTGLSGALTWGFEWNFGGTSAACPYVAGTIAVIQEAAKDLTGNYLTPSEVKNLLVSNGDQIIDHRSGANNRSKPRINIANALQTMMHKVSPSAGPNGKIDPDVDFYVGSGGSQTFNAIPNSDYVVDSWYVNGINVGWANSLLLQNINEDKVVLVTFKSSGSSSQVYVAGSLNPSSITTSLAAGGSGRYWDIPVQNRNSYTVSVNADLSGNAAGWASMTSSSSSFTLAPNEIKMSRVSVYVPYDASAGTYTLTVSYNGTVLTFSILVTVPGEDYIDVLDTGSAVIAGTVWRSGNVDIPTSTWYDVDDGFYDSIRLYAHVDSVTSGGTLYVYDTGLNYLMSNYGINPASRVGDDINWPISKYRLNQNDNTFCIIGTTGTNLQLSNFRFIITFYTEAPDIIITKSLSSQKVLVGDNVTVTVTAENFAENSTTGFDVVLKDSLPSGISLVSGSLNDNDFGDLEEEETRSNIYTIVASQPGHYTLPSARLEYESINGDDLADESLPVGLTVIYGQLSVQANVTAPRLTNEDNISISATVLDADGTTPVQDASVYALVEREVTGTWQTDYMVPMGWSVDNQMYVGLTPMIQSSGNYRVHVTAQKDLYDNGASAATEFEIIAPKPDITGEGVVNFLDFSVLANYWQFVNCNDLNNWCEKSDIDKSSVVDFDDLLIIAENWLDGASTELSNRIAIINPDSYRILKCGVISGDDTYVSVASAVNTSDDLSVLDPGAQWTGIGQQIDFLGAVLEQAGCIVDYFEASSMPDVLASDYGVVIVQDPLRTNIMTFDKATVDAGNLPDLLEHVTDAGFISKIDDYVQSGGNLVLIGDAVRLLENGTNRLNYGKTILAVSPSNIVDQASSWIPGQWLFTRGNPFCGADRNGSGQYTVTSGELMAASTILSNVSINNRSDLAYSHVWSETTYQPSDAVSLLNVNFSGTGEYVLDGSTCSPAVYYDTVDETVNAFIGYTEYSGHKIYYLGSDSYFDYNFKDWHGSWHTGESMEIDSTVELGGKNTVISLLNYIYEQNGGDVVIDPLEIVEEELDNFETGDFSAQSWTFGGNANWTVSNDTANDGSYSAKSGSIVDSQTSELILTLDTTGFEAITFAVKVSSESGYDGLVFYIDGVSQSAWSGEVDWQTVTYPVTSGQHTFEWKYIKDNIYSSGSDCAWIDSLKLLGIE